MSKEGSITVPFATDYTFGELASVHRSSQRVRGISQIEFLARISSLDTNNFNSTLAEKRDLETELSEMTAPGEIRGHRFLIREVDADINNRLRALGLVENRGFAVEIPLAKKMGQALHLTPTTEQAFLATLKRDVFFGNPVISSTDFWTGSKSDLDKVEKNPQSYPSLLDHLVFTVSGELDLSRLETVKTLSRIMGVSLINFYDLKSGKLPLDATNVELLTKYVADNPETLPYQEWPARLAASSNNS